MALACGFAALAVTGLGCAQVPGRPDVVIGTASPAELRSGRIDIGIVPSDVLADAVAGRGLFAARGPATDLRVLFAGHADAFTLVTHQESEIRTVMDLRG